MEQINKIELLGNVGSIRVQEIGGNQVANFSVVTNFAYKNKDGAAVIETMWHNVVAWNGMGMPDFSRITKGTAVHLSGRQRMRRFTGNDNTERQIIEVVASKLEIVENNGSLNIGHQ